MVATHYGLGLHTFSVNSRDPEYPTNLSHTFRVKKKPSSHLFKTNTTFITYNLADCCWRNEKHVWITMVLMASFFLCIKMTLLFFYKRLFLVTVVSCSLEKLFTYTPFKPPKDSC